MDDDMEMLKNLRKHSARNKKSFSSAINSKNLTDEDMDDLFLDY